MNDYMSDDSEDTLDEQEMQDIRWFIGDLGGGEANKLLLPSDRGLAGEVITLAQKNL